MRKMMYVGCKKRYRLECNLAANKTQSGHDSAMPSPGCRSQTEFLRRKHSAAQTTAHNLRPRQNGSALYLETKSMV